jgi:pyrimidine and pyridine-specific 5'-nucleotidase
LLTVPPAIVAVIRTLDVAVGAVDPWKRRVVTATRVRTEGYVWRLSLSLCV